MDITNETIGRILTILPDADVETVSSAVAQAASVVGGDALEALLDQALDILFSKMDTSSDVLNSNVKAAAASADTSSTSNNKSTICSGASVETECQHDIATTSTTTVKNDEADNICDADDSDDDWDDFVAKKCVEYLHDRKTADKANNMNTVRNQSSMLMTTIGSASDTLCRSMTKLDNTASVPNESHAVTGVGSKARLGNKSHMSALTMPHILPSNDEESHNMSMITTDHIPSFHNAPHISMPTKSNTVSVGSESCMTFATEENYPSNFRSSTAKASPNNAEAEIDSCRDKVTSVKTPGTMNASTSSQSMQDIICDNNSSDSLDLTNDYDFSAALSAEMESEIKYADIVMPENNVDNSRCPETDDKDNGWPVLQSCRREYKEKKPLIHRKSSEIKKEVIDLTDDTELEKVWRAGAAVKTEDIKMVPEIPSCSHNAISPSDNKPLPDPVKIKAEIKQEMEDTRISLTKILSGAGTDVDSKDGLLNTDSAVDNTTSKDIREPENASGSVNDNTAPVNTSSDPAVDPMTDSSVNAGPSRTAITDSADSGVLPPTTNVRDPPKEATLNQQPTSNLRHLRSVMSNLTHYKTNPFAVSTTQVEDISDKLLSSLRMVLGRQPGSNSGTIPAEAGSSQMEIAEGPSSATTTTSAYMLDHCYGFARVPVVSSGTTTPLSKRPGSSLPTYGRSKRMKPADDLVGHSNRYREPRRLSGVESDDDDIVSQQFSVFPSEASSTLSIVKVLDESDGPAAALPGPSRTDVMQERSLPLVEAGGELTAVQKRQEKEKKPIENADCVVKLPQKEGVIEDKEVPGPTRPSPPPSSVSCVTVTETDEINSPIKENRKKGEIVDASHDSDENCNSASALAFCSDSSNSASVHDEFDSELKQSSTLKKDAGGGHRNSKKRVWDRKHMCVYCFKLFSKLSRHLEKMHSHEVEVAKTFALPKNSSARKAALKVIMNRGNFIHNVHVAKSGKGELIAARRPTEKVLSKTFTTCDGCLGLFKKGRLWRHKKHCPKTENSSEQKRQRNLDPLLVSCSSEESQKNLLFKTIIFDKVVPTRITRKTKRDPIICQLGEIIFRKYTRQPHLYQNIRQKMREHDFDESGNSASALVYCSDSTNSSSVHGEFDSELKQSSALKKHAGGGHKNSKKRVWDKRHMCVYCSKLFSKLSKHLEKKHSQEVEVAKILALPKNSRSRKAALKVIMNRGDYIHNVHVAKSGKGELIAARRPTEKVLGKNFTTCDGCLGLFKKGRLWRHKKQCPKTENSSEQKQQRNLDPVLVSYSNPEPQQNFLFKTNILDKLAPTLVTRTIKRDPIICQLGEIISRRCTKQSHQYQHVIQKMRELGKFLIEMKKLEVSICSIRDCIDPTKFNTIVAAVRNVSGFNEETALCRAPSLALKLGYSLRMCAHIVWSNALKEGNDEEVTRARGFVSLLKKSDWAHEISSHALKTMKEHKYNKAEDLKKVHDRINIIVNKAEEELKTHLSPESWQRLAAGTLAQVLLFNRRRGGEMQRMELQQYQEDIVSGKGSQEEVLESLTLVEKKMVEQLHEVEVCGKRGQYVPVLLTQSHRESIDLLLDLRKASGIPEKNKFVSVFLSDALGTSQKYVQDCGAAKPGLLTTTFLQKHLGSICQLLNFEENELDCLASFLDYDIPVDKTFSQLPEDTDQIANDSEVFVQLEKENINVCSGKKLDDITVNEDKETEFKDSDSQDTEGSKNLCVKPQDAFNSTVNFPSNCSNSKNQKRKRRSVVKRPWSDEEVSAVKRCLGKYFGIPKLPGKTECIETLKKEPVLHHRTWVQIKSFIKNRKTNLGPT